MLNTKEVNEMLKENPPKTGLDYVMRVRGITNEGLGRQLDTDPKNISGWRNGRMPQKRESREEIAEVLGETEYFLFFQKDNWENRLSPTG